MDETDMYNMLTREGVIEERGTLGTVTLTDEYVDTIQSERERHQAKSAAQTEERIRSITDGPTDGLESIAGDWDEFLCHYIVLGEMLPAINRDERIRVGILLSQFEQDPPRRSGSPDTFLPIHCRHLEYVVQFYTTAIVYVWKDDCEPCDLVKADLDDCFEERNSDLGLFSVFGPEDPEYLERTYDVVGGPTILFLYEGEVDARLQGAHYPEIIENEIERLRSRQE